MAGRGFSRVSGHWAVCALHWLTALQRFIDDPELAVRMGQRSRELAEEKYDVNKVNAVMLSEMGIK